MVSQCLDCGTNERIQGHHVSYEPEEIIILCVDCHNKRHPCHGVGLGIGEYENKLTGHEQEFIDMWTAKFTYYNIMEKFQISIVTVRNWANMLELGGKPIFGTTPEIKKVNLTLSIREDITKEAKDKGIKLSEAFTRLLIYLLHEHEGEIPKELLRDDKK